MKGLVLSGGHGTRLRPITYSQQKQLVPIANKPILFYAIEDIIEADIHDIAIIVGPNREQVVEAVQSRKWDATVEFISQDSPRGIAHAVKISEDFLDDEPFVVYLGDNILREGITEHVRSFLRAGVDASILLSEVKNPQQFGVAELDHEGKVVRLVEKPSQPPSNLALAGIYLFKPAIFEGIGSIKPSGRGELEITDSIQWLIDNDYTVRASIVSGWWKDTGKVEDILEANTLILDDIQTDIRGRVESGTITGRVVMGEDTVLTGGSSVRGPTIIGRGCRISNAYIGPYTSIGDGCEIVDTEVEGSVVMDGTRIHDVEHVVDSLIGKNVLIEKGDCLPNGHRLNIGDNSVVRL
ncbi:MAG: glucose-1-phosphate thymidylyltransferase [Methermicoccaceae archaeon]